MEIGLNGDGMRWESDDEGHVRRDSPSIKASSSMIPVFAMLFVLCVMYVCVSDELTFGILGIVRTFIVNAMFYNSS